MDDIALFNRTKWDELARRGVVFSRPYLQMTPEQARISLDPHGMMGDVHGKDVLCLASGGGQQSIAFHLLGANVKVLDLSSEMLERDRAAARQYKAAIDIEQGDMRDLSRFSKGLFDVVWHAYSINFIPDPKPVFAEVARVLRPGGLYRLEFHNPLVTGIGETDWDGQGYPLRLFYENGLEIEDPPWEFEDEQGEIVKIRGPRAFRHTLSGVINSLVGLNFSILGVWEEVSAEYAGEVTANPIPGTWEHFIRVAPPWVECWWRYQG